MPESWSVEGPAAGLIVFGGLALLGIGAATVGAFVAEMLAPRSK